MPPRLLFPLAALALGLVLPPRAAEAAGEPRPPTLTDIGAGLPGVSYGVLAWGDSDNDGDLDLAISGYDNGTGFITRVYRNANGAFVDAGAGIPAVYDGALAWGDYDGDGDLDLAVSGNTGAARITRVYRNTNGAFVDAGAGIPGVQFGALAWGDADGDGDLDLAVSGDTGAGYVTRVYRNTGSTFLDADANLPGVRAGSLAWGDYDSDSDLDLAMSGETGAARITRVYRNDNGAFADAAAGIPVVADGTLAWGDYDSDGDLDLAVSGGTGGLGRITRVYRNDSGAFTDIAAGLPGIFGGDLAWGDYDSDGDLDLAMNGATSAGNITRVYRNTNGAFVDAGAGLPVMADGTLAWGDYDGDGDLDLALSGDTGAGYITRVYRSEGFPRNDRPSQPDDLTASVSPDGVALSWTAASDGATPAAALTYNVYVQTADGTRFAVVPQSLTGGGADGRRLVPAHGNAGARLSHTVRGLTGGATYRWSVQAVDAGLAGSPFVEAGSFTAPPFVATAAGLPGVYDGALAWGDYDNDGDLDLAMSGYSDGSGLITRVYRNTNGAFADAGAGLLGAAGGALSWGDYDGDGDLDLAMSGETSAGSITRVYRNSNGVFADAGAGLPGVYDGALSWGDYDGDGDLDLAVSGGTGAGSITRVYRNANGAFADAAAGIPGLTGGGLAWGDYDGDGDLDLVVSGATGTGHITRVYRNSNGAFADAAAGLPAVYDGTLAWGDYDGDGDLDLVVSGGVDAGRITRVYRNAGGAFTDVGAVLPGVQFGDLAWGDYDGDGDLDLTVSGLAGGGASSSLTRVYRNAGGVVNAAPSAPASLAASASPDGVTLSWTAASDGATPAAALTYNVYVQTADGTRFAVVPQSLTGGGADGRRLVPAHGNAGARLSHTVRGLPRGATYRWSVQAVDAGLAGSPFAEAGSFVSGAPPVAALTLAGAAGWRMLAAPRAGLTYGDVLGRLWTQGFTGSDAPAAPASSCSAFVFNEAVRTDTDGDGAVTLHDGWTCLANQAAAWPVGSGLMVYVYADDDASGTVTAAEAFPKVLPLAGALAAPPFTAFGLSFTDAASVPHSQEGWNLVGNPIPFGVDWDFAGRSPDVGATLSFYDPAFNGGDYRTQEAGSGGDIPGGVLAPGQGFFVKANGPNPMLIIPYDAVAATDPPLYGLTGGDRTAARGDVGETPGTPGPAGGPAQVASGTVAADDAPTGLAVALEPVRPNPFRGAATVAFDLPAAGPVRLTLVDVLGRAVAVLAEGEHTAGRHEAALAAGPLAPGVYVVRLEAGGVSLSRRVTVAR